MARNKQIRLTKNDRKEYAKLVKNSKAKIRRTNKNYGIDLSNEVEIRDLDSFQSRKEFNEWKEKQESFTNRNNLKYQFVKNDFGVVASKSFINEVERNNAREIRIAKERKAKLENAPFISGGKVQGTVGERVRMMANPNAKGISIPSKFNFNKIHSYGELQKRAERIKERANTTFYDKRSERFKDRYIFSLEQMFNSDADPVVELLKQVSGEDFYELYQMFDEFEPVFDPSPQSDYDGMWIDEGNALRQLKQIETYLEVFLERGFDGISKATGKEHLKGF